MTNIKFKFDRLSGSSMKDKTIPDITGELTKLTIGQVIQIHFSQDGYYADFEIIDKEVKTCGDAIALWYEYTLKYVPRTTKTEAEI